MFIDKVVRLYSRVFPKPANKEYSNTEVIIKLCIWLFLIGILVGQILSFV